MNSAVQFRRFHGKRAYPHPGHFLGSGNRCGHDKARPAFLNRRAASHTVNTLPKLQQKFRNIFHPVGEEADYTGPNSPYYDNPRYFPELSNTTSKANLDGQPQHNRSEARDSQCAILATILEMTDFSQLHIGTPRDDGTFKYRSWSEIAIAASSPDRLYFEKVDDPIKPDEHKYKPTQAFFARITELQAMGILYVQERYMKDAAGGAFAIVAVKQLNRNWLLSLGVCSNRQLSAFQARCKSMINERRALWRANRPDKVAAANERKEAQAKLRARRPLNPSSLLTRKAALAATVQDSEPDVLEQLKRQYAAFQASLLAQIVKEAEQHSHPPSWVRAESLHRYKTFEQFQKDI